MTYPNISLLHDGKEFNIIRQNSPDPNDWDILWHGEDGEQANSILKSSQENYHGAHLNINSPDARGMIKDIFGG